MTQEEFAKRLNISKSTVSSYENDSRLPSYDSRKGFYLPTDDLTDEQICVINQLLDIFKKDNYTKGLVPPKSICPDDAFHKE